MGDAAAGTSRGRERLSWWGIREGGGRQRNTGGRATGRCACERHPYHDRTMG